MILTSHDLELLDKYNNFLLDHGYTDTDIYAEEPTAINQFIEEIYSDIMVIQMKDLPKIAQIKLKKHSKKCIM